MWNDHAHSYQYDNDRLDYLVISYVPPTAVFLSPFEGIHGYHYSHSYGTVVGSGVLANVSSTDALYSKRIAKRLMLTDMTQRSTAGFWALDVLNAATAGANVWTQNSNGLVIWDGTENDLLSDGGTTNGIIGYKNALRAFLWMMFCGTRVEHTDGTFTFPTGTWATETAAAELSGGSANLSYSNGAVSSISFTGTDAVLFLVGRQDGLTVNATVANGGTAQVQVDGVTVASQSLSNQYVQSTASGTRAKGPLAIPLLGMSSGAHTITVTNTGASGTALAVDFIAPLSARPPEVLVYRQAYIPPYVSLATPAGVDLFNAALEVVVAEFTALNKPVSVVHLDGFDTTSMLSTTQPRHLNDAGSKFFADQGMSSLKSKSFRLGINNL